MNFTINDGGRAASGYKGYARDCAVRSISIVAELPYQEVYNAINHLSKLERTGKRKKGKSNSRTGVYRTTVDRYMKELGYTWHPTMFIGSGCKVHLKEGELPQGRLLVCVSRHYTAVIDGIIHDTHYCGRNGTRCVYGYYKK